MPFEVVLVADLVIGFTAYYIWFHSRFFPKVPKTSLVCIALSFLLSLWLVAAALATPQVEKETIYPVHKTERNDGAISEYIYLEDSNPINVNSAIRGTLPPDSSVKVTRYKETILGLTFRPRIVLQILKPD